MIDLRTLIVATALLSSVQGCKQSQPSAQPQWTSLFNGQDLQGWTIKISGHPLNENYLNTVRVEDGILKVEYDQYHQWNDEFIHIFYNQKFSHYRLRMQYRFLGEPVPGAQSWAYRRVTSRCRGKVTRCILKISKYWIFPKSTDNRNTLKTPPK